MDALPPQFRTHASDRLQLAFVVAGETDHKMGQASIGIASEAVSNGGGRTSEPCLCLFHYFAATGIVGFQKLSNARFRARDVIVDADGQLHRTVERVRVAPPFAPHRPHLLPLLAKNFGRGRDREPAVEVARCALHSATRIAAHPDWRAALAVRDGSDHRVLKLPAPIPTDRLSGPEGTAQPHAFENPPNPFFERYADCGEFGVDAREIRTDTNAEDKPPLADLVEGRRLNARVAPGFAAPAAARPCLATPASSAPRPRPASPAAHGAADQSASRQSRSNRSLAIPPARPTAAAERPPVCLASHVRVSAVSIQLLVPPGSPSARVRSPRPLCSHQ